MVNHNTSPEQKTPLSLKLAVGVSGVIAAFGVATPFVVQANQNRPQPETLAEVSAEVQRGSGRPADAVIDTVCSAADQLVQQTNLSDEVEAMLADRTTCATTARDLMADADGANYLVGKEITISVVRTAPLFTPDISEYSLQAHKS